MGAKCSKKILLIASSSDGHRKNYLAVLGLWFVKQGYALITCSGPCENGMRASDCEVLQVSGTNPSSTTLDLNSEILGSPIILRNELNRLVHIHNPTWTILVDGEGCAKALGNYWGDKCDRNKRAAIFIYFRHEYRPDFRQSSILTRPRLWARHFRDRHRRRLYFHRDVWSQLGLDTLLVTDENACRSLDHSKIVHLPEIYRSPRVSSCDADSNLEAWRKSYANFLKQREGREVVLYFGTRFARRGYDTLIELCAQVADTVFVSVGRNQSNENFSDSMLKAKSILQSQNRLFELNIPYLPDNALVDDLFTSANFVTLPYRNWYGMSGSLFQACSYGCPVLVPDIGHMSACVKQNGIGLTYQHLNCTHLLSQFSKLRLCAREYRQNTEVFSQQFSDQSINNALKRAFCGSGVK